MRSFLIATVAFGIALGSWLPDVGRAQPAGQDSVAGAVTNQFGTHLTFDARSGPSGENPAGTVTIDVPSNPPNAGRVTCLSVTGNQAAIGVDHSLGQVVYFVFDEDPDRLAVRLFSGQTTPIVDCPSDPGAVGAGLFSIAGGDLMVTDAQPLPTNSDDCKRGGWRAFGVFKNQGDCVSFVVTGGKNPPSR